MKHSKIVFLLFIATIFSFSCSKSDDSGDLDASNLPQLIVGVWQFTSSATNGTADALEGCDSSLLIEFAENMDFGQIEYSGEQCDMPTQSIGTYSLSGSTITITLPQGSASGNVVSISGNTFTIEVADGQNTYRETYTKIQSSPD